MKDQIVKAISEGLENQIWFGFRLNKNEANKVAAEIAEKLLPIVGEKDYPYTELFDHMSNEHGLNLTNTELGDIIHVARGK